MHNLAPSDRTTLIDVKDFTFQLNNFPCNGSSSLLLLVLVRSAPGNVEKRRTIRQTWGRGFRRVLFLLGAVEFRAAQATLEEENRTYRDLVQGRFLDSYRNLTHKHVMGSNEPRTTAQAPATCSRRTTTCSSTLPRFSTFWHKTYRRGVLDDSSFVIATFAAM